MGIKRKLYENIARHLKGGAWARVGRTKVSALGAERIRLVMKTYTFRSENVYVSSVKRIRFRHETYTSWAGAEFASLGHGA